MKPVDDRSKKEARVVLGVAAVEGEGGSHRCQAQQSGKDTVIKFEREAEKDIDQLEKADKRL